MKIHSKRHDFFENIGDILNGREVKMKTSDLGYVLRTLKKNQDIKGTIVYDSGYSEHKHPFENPNESNANKRTVETLSIPQLNAYLQKYFDPNALVDKSNSWLLITHKTAYDGKSYSHTIKLELGAKDMDEGKPIYHKPYKTAKISFEKKAD
ncbi:MAG: hypothetical protein ACP5N1_04845 [Candidatus Woesearchaeota archaeon]